MCTRSKRSGAWHGCSCPIICVPACRRPTVTSTALNAAYARMAEHYGTAIIPARVKRPRDKPVVEGSVRFVANQVAAVLRNRRFVGLAELNEAIFDEVAEINARPFQKREDSRQIVFVRDEKPLLIPLPQVPFELADLRKAKVGPNYHLLTELIPTFRHVSAVIG